MKTHATSLATDSCLSCPATTLIQPKHLLDALPGASWLAAGRQPSPCGGAPSRMAGAPAGARVLRDMRRRLCIRAQFVDGVPSAWWTAVSAQSMIARGPPLGAGFDDVRLHGHRFGVPVGQCQAGVEQQAVAVLPSVKPCPMKQRVEEFSLPFPYAVEPRT